jgi:hypothetical protein
MQRMLSMRDLKPQDLQCLSQESVTALAAQMLGHIEQQARDLEVKQKLLECKDRDIAYRDARIEKITRNASGLVLTALLRAQSPPRGCFAVRGSAREQRILEPWHVADGGQILGDALVVSDTPWSGQSCIGRCWPIG